MTNARACTARDAGAAVWSASFPGGSPVTLKFRFRLYSARPISRAFPMLITSPHADVSDSDPHAQRGPCRGGGPLTHSDGPRRLSPEGRGRHLLVPAARLAGREEGRKDHPRGAGPRRLLGGLPAGRHPRGAVAGVGPLGEVRRTAPALQ